MGEVSVPCDEDSVMSAGESVMSRAVCGCDIRRILRPFAV